MNLLITGAWHDGANHIDLLKTKGDNALFIQNEKDKLPCDYDWVEGVVCNGLFLYHDIVNFNNLKIIQLTSAGYDRVPLEYINEHNIKIFNAKNVYSVPMAEFAVLMALSLYKKSKVFFENQQNKLWEKQRDLFELNNKTVGILGCGSVGSECAKRFKAFECRIVGFDINIKKQDFFDEVYLINDLKKYLKEIDILLLTLPLTEKTKHLINAETIDQLNKNAIIINISRGAIIDTKALYIALKNNKIYGAAIDVFEEEPLPITNSLWELLNVIITPHNSFLSEKVNYRLTEKVFENLIKALNYYKEI